jgi:hypothetical protein
MTRHRGGTGDSDDRQFNEGRKSRLALDRRCRGVIGDAKMSVVLVVRVEGGQ